MKLRYSKRQGFTLLELSIALIIIALITGMGLVAGQSMLDSANTVSTNNRLDAVEKALAAYRLANNRLPCPGDLTLTKASTNSAYEASNPGSCSAGAIVANFTTTVGAYTATTNGNVVVEGSVPTRTLGLPDEFMYDGWGRKIDYAVWAPATGVNGLVDYGDMPNCGIITIKPSSTAAATTTSAVYTLVSFGPNGHGGYDNGGARILTGSVNADVQTNCHCDATGNPLALRPANYIVHDATQDPTNVNNGFDNVVRYKERWQLRNYQDETNPGGNLICPTMAMGVKAVSSGLGSAVASGDVNGDGIDDLIISSPGSNVGGGVNGQGAVYVLFGSLNMQTFPSLSALDGTNGFVLYGDSSIAGYAGSSVAIADFNGDGIADIIIGEPYWPTPDNDGSIFIVYGKRTGWPPSMNLANLDGTTGIRINSVSNESDGYYLTAGDINGDGKADILIGGSGSGRAYIVFGSSSLNSATPYTLDSSATGLIDGVKGLEIDVTSGSTLAGTIGDINADGLGDIILQNGINVDVIYGRKGKWTTPLNTATLDGNNGFHLSSPTGIGGYSLAVADINGDGINDLLIGYPYSSNNGANSGSLYVLFGKTAKWAKQTNVVPFLDGIRGFRIDGTAGEYFTYQIATGDINGDGIADMVISGYQSSPGGRSNAGSVYTLFGTKTAWPATSLISSYMDGIKGFRLNGDAGVQLGRSVATGDLNGDGRKDAIAGSTGAGYVFFGERKTGNWPASYDASNLR